jgi:hypothetical protein
MFELLLQVQYKRKKVPNFFIAEKKLCIFFLYIFYIDTMSEKYQHNVRISK